MADRFDKFTERARRVLTLAQEEAQRFGHQSIGTEHFLLALVREGDGIAARVLNNLGVQLPKVRAAVEARVGRGASPGAGEIGLTPRAKKVIELAVDEARRLNHHYIGTEHLLLGLVREGQGIAAEILEDLGLSLEKLRAQVIQVLSGGSNLGVLAAASERPPAAPPDLRAAMSRLDALRHEIDAAIAAQDLDRASALQQQEWDSLARIAQLVDGWVRPQDPMPQSQEWAGSIDFDRFTAGARRALTFAQEEAQRFNHNYIGTEHLLLGLAREPDEVAGRVLAQLGVQLPRLRAAVEFIIGRGETMIMGEVGLTPRAKKVLTLAVAEARQLGSAWVGTEHLLLGLVGEGQGIAAGVLESTGASLGAVRDRVLAMGGGGAGLARPVAPTEHRLGRPLRAVPAAIDGGRQALSVTIGVTLRELDLYEGGFVAHLTLALVGPWTHPPDFLATAEDERGGLYRGTRSGGSGGDDPQGFVWRDRYDFAPALDPAATVLTLTLAPGRRRGREIVADASLVTWVFTVPLGPETPAP